MTHAVRIVAVAVLVALALCVPVQAQTPEIDALRVRAEAGDAGAQNDLGLSYAHGEGVPQDGAEAVRWYRLAADQGFARAQYSLGFMHDNGAGCGHAQRNALGRGDNPLVREGRQSACCGAGAWVRYWILR